jgi:hypothetical protein
MKTLCRIVFESGDFPAGATITLDDMTKAEIAYCKREKIVDFSPPDEDEVVETEVKVDKKEQARLLKNAKAKAKREALAKEKADAKAKAEADAKAGEEKE